MLWNHRKRKKAEERAEDGNGLTVGQRFDVGETFQDLARGPKGSPFNMLTLALAAQTLPSPPALLSEATQQVLVSARCQPSFQA
jgi:hypothetical protein